MFVLVAIGGRVLDRRRKDLESATRTFAYMDKIRSVSWPENRIHPACLGAVSRSAVFIARPDLGCACYGSESPPDPGPGPKTQRSRGSRCHGRRGLPASFETGPLSPASECATASPAAAALERRVVVLTGTGKGLAGPG